MFLSPILLVGRLIRIYNDLFFRDEDNAGAVRSTGVRCGLVPWALAGYYRDKQADLLSNFSCRIRWRGYISWGEITLTDRDELMWVPGRLSADWGAQRFIIRSEDESSALFSPVGTGRTGVIVRSSVGDEVRFVLRSGDVGLLREMVDRQSR